MALYASVLRPLGTSFFDNQCIVQIMKHEVGSFKLLNYKKRHFVSSMIRKKSSWKFKNLKDSEQGSERTRLFQNLNTAEATPFSISLIVKPFLFTVAMSSASIAGTAIWQYENIRKKAMTLVRRSWVTEKFNLYGKKKFTWRNEIQKFWSHLTEGEKLFVPICFINILVFLAWRIPKFQPTMIKYFCSTPFGSAVCWPMILSTFSHFSVIHLATNMYVLYSFSNKVVSTFGKEQFLGLYLAGGVISSFFSYLYKFSFTKNTLSMGASGAVMAIVAYSCAKDPDSKLAIVFLPWFVFSAGTGIKCLMGLDVLGVLCRWRFFDHAAHLGGAMSGLVWCHWGNKYIWQKKEPLLHWWHEIRSASK